jgi:alpha-ribazole phosphatase/probable phosphoglycerate mutase
MHITTHLDFLRHGEPVGGRKYRGQTDDPLSEKGWAQMRTATAGEHHWTALVSSPLRRCHLFALELARERSLELHLDERLKEVGFGVWEGRTHAELTREDADAVFEFKRDPIARRPRGAEDLQRFRARVGEAFEALLTAHRGGRVLVVCHAGVIRMAICHALGLAPEATYRLHIGSAAMAHIRIEERGERRLATLMHLTAGQGGD